MTMDLLLNSILFILLNKSQISN